MCLKKKKGSQKALRTVHKSVEAHAKCFSVCACVYDLFGASERV